MHGQQNIKKM